MATLSSLQRFKRWPRCPTCGGKIEAPAILDPVLDPTNVIERAVKSDQSRICTDEFHDRIQEGTTMNPEVG